MPISTDNSGGQMVRVFDAVKALAFIGDLSMGQPTDHSLRTTWLGLQIARQIGADDAMCAVVREACMLRWSGCTANADGVAEALGDDVAGREGMLALKPGWGKSLEQHGGASAVMTPLAQIHCEVSGEVARLLKLSEGTERTLRNIFETWDGNGLPNRVSGAAIPESVFVVSLAGDLEIFSRLYGLETALTMIGRRADSQYPAQMVSAMSAHAGKWLNEVEEITSPMFDELLLTEQMDERAPLELVADVIDLKLPWMTGFSRSVATTAAQCAERLGLEERDVLLTYRAGLIHAIGRAAVPNAIWNLTTKPSSGAWEKLRLVPYWTSRAGKQTGSLAEAAELASYAYERSDGSGYFRGVGANAQSMPARILAASIAWVALRSTRPWRAALSDADATQMLLKEADEGRFDKHVVETLVGLTRSPLRSAVAQPEKSTLSAREADVLRLIARGASNKEVARDLGLSPSTIRTHVESTFRKLQCSTRAAATLKASAMGLL